MSENPDVPNSDQTATTLPIDLSQPRGSQPRIVVIVPPAFRPGDPCPDLLTEEEAIRYLRLDTINIKNPADTLKRYRDLGHLCGTQLSKRVFYLKSELDNLLKNLTNKNPR
jgi:hypothetical protein